MGEALGIEGAQQAGPDYATVQPDISATIGGTHVDIGWTANAPCFRPAFERAF